MTTSTTFQWRLFACGFYPVEFADFWIADQLTSLASLLLDVEYLICFYAFDGDINEGLIGWFLFIVYNVL